MNQLRRLVSSFYASYAISTVLSLRPVSMTVILYAPGTFFPGWFLLMLPTLILKRPAGNIDKVFSQLYISFAEERSAYLIRKSRYL